MTQESRVGMMLNLHTQGDALTEQFTRIGHRPSLMGDNT